jgi:hypothetical protein
MKKQLICLAMGLISLLTANGQWKNPVPENPLAQSIGLLVGTTGIGLEYYRPLGNQLGVQAGFSLMPFTTHIMGQYGQYDTRNRVETQMHNAHILLAWEPFHYTGGVLRHFTINAGAAYFFRLMGTVRTTLDEPYYYGDILVSSELLGSARTRVSWGSRVMPHFGFALTNVRIDERFGFNVGIGGYYLPSPEVRMTGTNLLSDNEHNGPIIERNLRDYRLLPQLQLGVNYKLQID